MEDIKVWMPFLSHVFTHEKLGLVRTHVNTIEEIRKRIADYERIVDSNDRWYKDLIKLEKEYLKDYNIMVTKNFPACVFMPLVKNYFYSTKRFMVDNIQLIQPRQPRQPTININDNINYAPKPKKMYNIKLKYLALAKNHIDEYALDDCPICLNKEILRNTILTDCKHQFCNRCFDDWKKSCNNEKQLSCPTCRNHCKIITAYKERKPRQKNKFQLELKPLY